MIIFELPFYNKTSGGITDTILMAEKMNASVRFQRLSETPYINVLWSVGMPDSTLVWQKHNLWSVPGAT